MPDDAGFARDLKRKQLQVIASDLPATARELRDLFAAGSAFYDRGGVVARLAHPADGGPPVAVEVTAHGVVCEAHRLAQPMAWKGDNLSPVTLSERVAKMFLDMRGEWNLPPLDGISTAPVLADDGSILDRDGYDPRLRLWCAAVPRLDVPEHPTEAQARAALHKLRSAFRTFPFGDSQRVPATVDAPSLVDLTKPARLDETAALCATLTAISRPSLHLAPGFMGTAPAISGAGAGKGLLVRAVCLIAFGVPARAFTAGAEKAELDKRLVAELIEAAPVVFLDNVNGTALRNDLLASVLTERPARVRIMGRSLMVPLNSTAFIAVTGNGLSMSEDLARRFLSCNLDAQMEDPESRPFAPGYLVNIAKRRPELLSACLTIWRWGRQHANLKRGRKLGSFEQWAEWVRDPLLTLGCADPVDRILEAKAADPARKRVTDLFEVWYDRHVSTNVLARNIHDDVRDTIDPTGKGRQFISTHLDKLDGTRAAGFLFRRYKTAKWSPALYGLEVVDGDAVAANAAARREASTGTAPNPYQEGSPY